ncbi:hypothetical protein BaRGS_00027905, partial [Batillaria attramentaria]
TVLGRLATVKDDATQTFLQHTLLNHFHHRGPVWIGLSNTANNSTYVWDSALTSTCRLCGDKANGIPCTDLEKAFAPFSKCPEDKPYCMNDIYHSDGLVDVYERCVSRDTCNKEWFVQSSTKAQCAQYDHTVFTDGLECHLCCYGDSCNDDLVPPNNTWFRPAAPVKPSQCYTCGDLDKDIPCSRLELIPDNPVQCPDATPFCMNDIYQEDGQQPSVFKRCVDEATCYAEWYFRSSDKAECSQYDPNVYTGTLTCHLCCRGDLCNARLLPEQSTLYTP